MAKNWIKKAIKHPGRCTPGSPNYDCPKGSPQWNLAQRFKHGDLHKKEYGGMAASDNVDMGYYSNPLKYFAAMGINISDDDCLECGGKITAETIYSVSKQPKVILTPNDIYAKDGANIDLSNTTGDRKVFSLDEFKNIVPNYQYQGYLNSGKEGMYKNIDKLKYPVQVDTLPDGSVTYRPYSYESAETSYEDYKKLSQSDQPIKATPIKTFAGGGMMSGMMGGGQGGGNGAGMIMQGVTQAIGGIFSTLDAQKKATEQQGQQNLQNAYQMQQINDLKAMELEQQQQFFPKGGKVEPIYTDNPKDKRLKAYNDSLSLYKKYPNNKYAIESTFDNLNSVNNNVQSGIDSKTLYPNLDFANNNKIKPTKVEWAQTGGGNYTEEELKKGNWVHYNVNGSGANGVTRYFTYKKPVQPVVYKKKEEVRVPVPKVNYLKNIPQTDEEDIKIDFNSNLPIPQAPNEDEQTTKGKPLPAYLIQQVKTPNGMKTYKRKDTNSPWIEQDFEKGGIVQAWIQKFSNGGYIADGGFPGGQELTQPTTNYYNWGNYGNQNSFLTPEQINQKPFENPYQNMNLQQPNVPQFNIPKGQEIEPLTSIGAQKMTPDLQGIRNRANQSMQDIAPKSKSPMNMNAVNMGLDIGTQSMSAAANLMGSLGKDNSKAQAFGQGASGAMNVASQVTAPFKDIPIAGKAIDAVGKTLGFFIGGALEARRQGIENEEMDKYNKLQEYTSRNTQTAQQPSYYGQYMSKYGSNIKNLEQRLVDDIFSDYDKFMKLT